MAVLPASLYFREEAQALSESIALTVLDLVRALESQNAGASSSEVMRALDAIEAYRKPLDRFMLEFRAFRSSQTVPKRAVADLRELKWYEKKKTEKALASLRSDKQKWPRMLLLAEQLLDTKPTPLYRSLRPVDLRNSQLSQVSDMAFQALHNVIRIEEQDPEAEDHGCYTDIMMRHSKFLKDSHAALRVWLAQAKPGPARFLDVGCGTGVQVITASNFFGYCDGLEYDLGYLEAAQRAIEASQVRNCTAFQGDALVFDGYSKYDVIYFYQPMKDDQKLRELERKIVKSARPGTILIAPYEMFTKREENFGFSHIAGNIFVAGISTDEAKTLKDKAEHMGLAVLTTAQKIPEQNGFWEPLIRYAFARGYIIL